MGELHYKPRWRRLRAHQLDKEPLCRMCAAEGRTTPATVADHIVPHRNQGMPFWRGELQSLCASCHSSRKQFIENRGYDNAIGSDGWPVDSRHPVYGGRKKCRQNPEG